MTQLNIQGSAVVLINFPNDTKFVAASSPQMLIVTLLHQIYFTLLQRNISNTDTLQ
jgi:hypothetical protein